VRMRRLVTAIATVDQDGIHNSTLGAALEGHFQYCTVGFVRSGLVASDAASNTLFSLLLCLSVGLYISSESCLRVV
jgi:hypothetical protein